MATFVEEYLKLIIKQYFNQPRASAEMELKVKQYETLYNIIAQFTEEFDIDQATGDRLDKIGKIVGVNRSVNSVVDKIAFGFADNPNARGFADKDNNLVVSAPFFDRFTPEYTPLQLDDATYRQIIKVKISVNNTSAYLVSDDRISIQEVIQQAFEGQAWVVDNYNMTLTLYLTPTFEEQRLRLITELNLLPKPQAVGYNVIINAEVNETFGFDDNQYALSFGDKFGSRTGYFANKVIL